MRTQILGINNPLISVIIPIYNVEKYLHKCVDSVLAQTYKNLEIILVDDGSTDASGQICDEYAAKDSRIKVIHKPNGGVSSARNAGLKVASGEYIGFVDGDDYIELSMYQILLDSILQTHSDIARCEMYGWKPIMKNRWCGSAPQAMELFYPYIYIYLSLISRKIIKNIRFDETITLGEDMKFYFEVVSQAQYISYTPSNQYHYVINSQSATQQTFNPKKLSYFKATQASMHYAKTHHLLPLQRQIEAQICYHAVGFLRQIAMSGFQDKVVIEDLRKKIRRGLVRHLFSHHKLTNKLFALMCCINFNLTVSIYLCCRRNYEY